MLAICAAAVDRAGKPGFRATLAAAGARPRPCWRSPGSATSPLNRRTMSYPGDGDAQGWATIRRRWERLHIARVLLDLTAFA